MAAISSRGRWVKTDIPTAIPVDKVPEATVLGEFKYINNKSTANNRHWLWSKRASHSEKEKIVCTGVDESLMGKLGKMGKSRPFENWVKRPFAIGPESNPISCDVKEQNIMNRRRIVCTWVDESLMGKSGKKCKAWPVEYWLKRPGPKSNRSVANSSQNKTNVLLVGRDIFPFEVLL